MALAAELVRDDKIRKKKTAKKQKKRTRKKARFPFSQSEAKSLGYEYADMIEAGLELHKGHPRLRKELAWYLKRYTQLKIAYERGVFLRRLSGLAEKRVSVTHAAGKLKLPSGQALREILDSDDEAGDLWEQGRLDTFLQIRQSVIENAKKGKADALKACEMLWRDEELKPAFDPAKVSIYQLCEITGKNRKTIHEWHTQAGLPRAADKTFDLAVFFSWFEGHVIKNASKGKGPESPLNPFQQVKTERERLQLEKEMGKLVAIGKTVGWQCAQLQNIMNVFEKIADYANLMFGQPREEIMKVLEDLRDSVAAQLQHVPEFLKMKDDAKEKLLELYCVMTGENEGRVD